MSLHNRVALYRTCILTYTKNKYQPIMKLG